MSDSLRVPQSGCALNAARKTTKSLSSKVPRSSATDKSRGSELEPHEANRLTRMGVMRTRSVVRTNITEKEEDDKYLHITKKGREGRITSVSFVIRYGRGMCFGEGGDVVF